MELFEKDRQGMVLRMERSSVHDGDGFRTVVFLKGCPLRCRWCSTPESQSFQIEEGLDGTVYGAIMTVEEVLRYIRKDSLCFFLSGGGITLSGGEILAQPEFTLALLKNAKREGFNTAVETSLFAPWEVIESILPYVDTIYADLKLVSPKAHKYHCGMDNQIIVENFYRLSQAEGSFRLVVRIPIIPGINDGKTELVRFGGFCAKLGERLDHIQLLPYHRLGSATYEKLGRPYLLKDVKVPSPEAMACCREIVAAQGVRVK